MCRSRTLRDKGRPLVIMLHGYTVSSAIEEVYPTSPQSRRSAGLLPRNPDGGNVKDAQDKPRSGTPPTCCDFGGAKWL
jgi:hypothetical protein